MKDFVAHGFKISRCPTTQRLRVSTQDSDTCLSASVASVVAARSNANTVGGAAAEDALPLSDIDLSVFAGPPSFSFASSPSEVISSINNINLAESIAKHKQWAMPAAAAAAGEKAAAAAAVTAAVGGQQTDTDADEALEA